MISLPRVLLGTALITVLLMGAVTAQQGVYYKDAVQLAARLSSEEMVSELSEHLIYTIEDALVSVAGSSYREAHAVVQQYKIHTTARSSTQKLHLIVDNKAPWLNNLKGQNPITTYFQQQAVHLTILEQTKEYTSIELYSEASLNMKYLANELSIIEHVWLVEIPSEQKIGKDIQLLATEQGYRLVYSCPVDMESQQIHYWEFLVSNAGEVIFIGEYGAALTAQIDRKNRRF